MAVRAVTIAEREIVHKRSIAQQSAWGASGTRTPFPVGTQHPREGTTMTIERQIAANRQNV
jgi:hypothetical protein